MTPPPTTSAGKRAASGDKERDRGGRKTPAPGAGHRRTLSRNGAQRSSRRLSGPLAGRAAGLLGRRGRADAGNDRAASVGTQDRSVAGTTSLTPEQRRARRHTPKPGTSAAISTQVLAYLKALPDHPLFDRIVRGRAWIALLGLMLAGIVAMQVEQLKLGASIGRSIERTSRLQTRNEQLQGSISQLSDEQRIERLAVNQGMIMPPPAAIDFLPSPSKADVQKAISNIHMPDAAGFSSLQTGSGAVVTSAAIDALAPSSTSPGSTQSSQSTAAPTQQTAAATSQTTAATQQTAAATPQTNAPSPRTAAAAPSGG
jgi:hypothetical protein